MSKLSFRARALDASKPMPIYMAEELPDLPDYSAINRAVPQMPSGMEKEEECEHHLQRAICAGLIIPTPEVSEIPDKDVHDRLYPANYKQPRQLIHMQPFTMEQDIPDYDMDSDDERWLDSQTKRIELSALKFEEMMDRLEKSSGQTVVTLNEAKALLKEDDDLIIAVFDYWLNKRLKLQHPLILSVKTEHRVGTAANNPYLAFRRRTEKMQTRKNRKNDETSYEKMLKLRRDLSRAVTLLDFVKRREKIKREYVHLTVEIFEKRYQAKDFSGAIISELSVIKAPRPAFTPIFQNHYANQNWTKSIMKDEIIPRKEKRQYKKRKHKSLSHNRMLGIGGAGLEGLGVLSSDEEPIPQASPEPEEVEEDGQFAFRRNKLCSYHMPIPMGNWPWCSKEENGSADKRYRYTLTSLSNPRRCIGFARRRMGRGGRVIFDRLRTDFDELWRGLDFTIYDGTTTKKPATTNTPEEGIRLKDSFSTNVYSDVGHRNSNFVKAGDESRTSFGVLNCDGDFVKSVVKEEPEEVAEEVSRVMEVSEHTPEDQDEMVEFMQSIQKDWLHFRPKTPSPGYTPPCHLLPPEDNTFIPSSNTPFTLELRGIDDVTSALADNSTFVTGTFLYEDLALDGCLDVPVTDTRQTVEGSAPTTHNTLITANATAETPTTTPCVNPREDEKVSVGGGEERTIGCSRFTIIDVDGSAGSFSSTGGRVPSLANTATSPKLDSVNVASDVRQRSSSTLAPDCGNNGNSANGIISQFGMDVSPCVRTKLNKKLYAYTGEVGSAGTNALSLLTSAHTVTLNSHSANILEIPISNDADSVPTKVVAAQCETNSTPANNNKNKTIVRKNNLAMEVT
nr:enhancer of polycomb homolog 1 [Onthophagus taurus]